MKKTLLHIVVLVLVMCSINTFAQTALPLTNEAIKAYQSGDFLAAESKIKVALLDKKESKDAYTQYTAGFIYKELYKSLEPEKRESTYRAKATNYLQESLLISPSGTTAEMAKAALKYIAVSYFNDALRRTVEITEETKTEPEALYSTFRKNMRLVDAQTDFTPYDIQLFKALGQAHYRLWEANTADQKEALQAADYYQRVLILDENDCEAAFNLVILYYNQGVYKIRSIDLNTDLSEIIPLQEKAIRFFNQALPLAQQCFYHCPASADYYKGLMFCNRALGNEEEYLRLKTELEAKISQGLIQVKK
jgi:hypothetical protein